MRTLAYNRDFRPADRLGAGLKWLMIVNLAVFLVCLAPQARDFIHRELALHAGVFKPWQAFSYMFVHFGLMHLFCNMLGLFFFGGSVEDSMGTRAFVRYYLMCGAAGGLAAYLMGAFIPVPATIGASGAVYGVLYACYRFFPETVVYFWGLFPIRLKYLLLAYFFFDFLSLFDQGSEVASYAHIGGLLAGVAYFGAADRARGLLDSVLRKKRLWEAQKEDKLRLELDRILAKIHEQGIGSLGSGERRVLKKASRMYSGRDRG